MFATYFNTTEAIDGLQVLRTYRLNATFKKGSKLSSEIMEVSRLWLNPKGQTAVTELRRTLGYYLDNFNWESKIELRNLSEVYTAIADCNTFHYFSAIPELRRNGLKGISTYNNPFLLMKYLLTDSRMETLIKSGHKGAIRYYTDNHHRLDTWWDSLKVAYCRGYEPEDYSLWCDTITILHKLERDISQDKIVTKSIAKKVVAERVREQGERRFIRVTMISRD